MFKLFLILPILTMFSFAGEYDDIELKIDYDEAISIGKIEGKPVMVLITSKRCKWCKKFKKKTFSDDKIINRLNENFSVVEVTRKKDDYPYKKLRARAVPTIYFLNSNGKPFMRPVIGYWNIENFNSYLSDAERKFKK